MNSRVNPVRGRSFSAPSNTVASNRESPNGEPLLVLCGPTAGGKTALVRMLADAADIAVISADSRQIYRGFDVGTAKPPAADRARVPHACIDVAEPTARYTAYAWAAEARQAVSAALVAGRTPVVVGGAGFYIRALVHPVTETSPAGGERFAARYLLLDPGAVLGERIARRAAVMLGDGWVEEVEQLMLRVPAEAPAWQASGYEAVRAYVDGRLSLAAALDRVVIATRQYAKRQRTWFRHQLPGSRVVGLDPDDGGSVRAAVAWLGADGAGKATRSAR